MKRLIVVLFFAFILVGTIVGDRITTRHFQAQAAPMSAFDMAIESRTTAPAESGNSSAFGWGIALVAGAVLVFGGAILAMGKGSELARQLRLSRKRQRPRNRPTIDQLPEIRQLPTAPRLPAMRPVDDYQE